MREPRAAHPGQEQFLQVLDRDEAERRFRAAIDVAPRGIETVSLDAALGRVLAADVIASVDVPSFDRSNVDGFAVIAEDTFGASEEVPRVLSLAEEVIHTAIVPSTLVRRGTAVPIATGGMMPRGADAVVMVEHADVVAQHTNSNVGRALSGWPGGPDQGHPTELHIRRAVTAGSGVSFAGTDITAGETVLRTGTLLTSRDTGVLAAIGVASIDAWRRPIVAILSTGDEIIAPGTPMQPARIYDSNSQVLADAVRELGGEARRLGITPDDVAALRMRVHEAIDTADIVLLSGGTSKGAGDVSYRIVAELTEPGIVAHGVALKPGKPICLAATHRTPVVVLPGFPTSAIFTFHEFVAPVITAMCGRPIAERATVPARLAVRVNSEIGRTEYLLVSLVSSADDGSLAAYPMGQGSGSVTTFSRADGFTAIGRHVEIVPAGTVVDVQLLGRDLQLADLVVIGSHDIGLDYLLGVLQQHGIRSKFIAVGSSAGLEAAKRGECDIAGVHLLDLKSGEYNRPFLTASLDLIPGYRRLQGVVYRTGDARFEGKTAGAAIQTAVADPSCVMVNRNAGSGTRVLIDEMLAGVKPHGYALQPRNHNAVAAAVAQRRADWGLTLDIIAQKAGLGFIPVRDEQYDFVVPRARENRDAVQAFRRILDEPATRAALRQLGLNA
ncbi:MAG TPA: molybdopterin biosynthesis protein [Vicinamibacterales bacterium]|jgi:putative molybdopterin biosynthesis protein|nr:molybdopterin biosynthesis protein [Vicinamibacterales bacterium]